MRATRWLCLCALLACQDEKPATAPATPAQAPPAPAVAPDAGAARTKSSGRPVHPPPQVKSASQGIAGVQAGAALPAADVVVGPGQELVLDFSAGGRVRLIGPAIARDTSAKFDALRVREATLSADLEPAVVVPDSGLFVTTPSACFSMVRGARYALRTFADGSSAVFVVSGTLSVAAAGPSLRNAVKPLLAGERLDVRLDGSLTRAKHAATKLEQAAQLAAELPEPKVKDPTFALLDKALRAASEALRKEHARTAEILIDHRAAVAEGAERRMAVQSELAKQAAKQARAKERLELALEQRAASRLHTARGTEAAEDALSREARALLTPSP
jgi:hypothetical protein